MWNKYLRTWLLKRVLKTVFLQLIQFPLTGGNTSRLSSTYNLLKTSVTLDLLIISAWINSARLSQPPQKSEADMWKFMTLLITYSQLLCRAFLTRPHLSPMTASLDFPLAELSRRDQLEWHFTALKILGGHSTVNPTPELHYSCFLRRFNLLFYSKHYHTNVYR